MLDEIRELQDRILKERENLIRAKIKECIRRIKEGEEQVEECRIMPFEEFDIFKKMLEKAGLKDKIDFYFDGQELDYNEYARGIGIRIPEGGIYFNEMSILPEFTEEPVLIEEVLNLKYIDLKRLGIEMEVEQKKEYNSTLNGYSGLFLDEENSRKLVEMQPNGLSDVVNDIHVTFKFGEIENFPNELMGKEFNLRVIGYASDGKNSGFKVELPEELKQYYKNPNDAHITVSIGEVDGVKGKPVDTGKLQFEELAEPFEISGNLGYFVFGKGVVMDNSEFEKKDKMLEMIDSKLKELEEIEKFEEENHEKYQSNSIFSFREVIKTEQDLLKLKKALMLNQDVSNMHLSRFFTDNIVHALDDNDINKGYSVDSYHYYYDYEMGDVPGEIRNIYIDGYVVKSMDHNDVAGEYSIKKIQRNDLKYKEVGNLDFEETLKYLDEKVKIYMKDEKENTEGKGENKNINLDIYKFDLDTYDIIVDEKNEEEIDNVYVGSFYEVISCILNNTIIDTRANAQFEEFNNYCEIGQYSDMPGEEIIPKVFNEVDRDVLREYFNQNPEDILLFEDIRKKYPDIKSLDEAEQEKNEEEIKLTDEEKKDIYSFEQFIKDTKDMVIGQKRPPITCVDGYIVSVQANEFLYCEPQKTGLDEYEEYEVCGVTERQIEQLKEWQESPDSSVYGYVPKEEIVKLLLEHGGLDKEIMKQKVQEIQEIFKPKNTKLERQIQEVSGGNEFIANLLRYATRKVEVREQNDKAQQLMNDYEKLAEEKGISTDDKKRGED